MSVHARFKLGAAKLLISTRRVTERGISDGALVTAPGYRMLSGVSIKDVLAKLWTLAFLVDGHQTITVSTAMQVPLLRCGQAVEEHSKFLFQGRENLDKKPR